VMAGGVTPNWCPTCGIPRWDDDDHSCPPGFDAEPGAVKRTPDPAPIDNAPTRAPTTTTPASSLARDDT
jgi:hypothetical protein